MFVNTLAAVAADKKIEAEASDIPVFDVHQNLMPGSHRNHRGELYIKSGALAGEPEAIRLAGTVFPFTPRIFPTGDGSSQRYFQASLPVQTDGEVTAEIRVDGEWIPVILNIQSTH